MTIDHHKAMTVLAAMVLALIMLVVVQVNSQPGPVAAVAAEAAPNLPPTFPLFLYGTARVNGDPVITGTVVGAWCGGVKVAQGTTQDQEGDAWYGMDIPGDDPETTSIKEGCVDNEVVSLTIAGVPAAQTTWWEAGGSMELHITGVLSVAVKKDVSPDQITWYPADDGAAALSLIEGDPLWWRMTVSNTTGVTVTLALTDNLDGQPVALTVSCDPVPPAELAPQGSAGAVYTCTLDDEAVRGPHQNTITATVTRAAIEVADFDAAHYTAIAYGVEVDKAVSGDGATWIASDTEATQATLQAGTELWWRIGVTNTGSQTATMTITDVYSGAVLSLGNVCAPPPPTTLAPYPQFGSSYNCVLSDTVAEGAYHNIVTATLAYESTTITGADGAYYLGITDFLVYLPLVLR